MQESKLAISDALTQRDDLVTSLETQRDVYNTELGNGHKERKGLLSQLAAAHDELSRLIKTSDLRHDSLQAENKALQKRLDEYIISHKNDMQTREETLHITSAELIALRQELVSIRSINATELSTLQTQLEDARSSTFTLLEESKMEHEVAVSSAENTIDSLSQEKQALEISQRDNLAQLSGNKELIAKLEQTIEDSRKNLSNLNVSIEELRLKLETKLMDSETSIQNLVSSQRTSQQQLQEREDENSALARNLELAGKEKTEAEKEISALRSSESRLTAEFGSLKRKISELEETIVSNKAEADGNLRDLEDSYIAEKNHYQMLLKNEIRDTTEKYQKNLAEIVEKHAAELAALSRERDDLVQQHTRGRTAIESDLAIAKSQVAEVNEVNSQMFLRISTLEAERQKAAVVSEQHLQSNDQLRAERDTIQKSLDGLKQMALQQAGTYKKSLDDLQSSNIQRETQEQQINDLTRKVESLESVSEERLRGLESLQGNSQKADEVHNAKVVQLSQQCDGLTNRVGELSSECQLQSDQIRNLLLQAEASKTERDRIDSEYSILRKRNNEFVISNDKQLAKLIETQKVVEEALQDKQALEELRIAHANLLKDQETKFGAFVEAHETEMDRHKTTFKGERDALQAAISKLKADLQIETTLSQQLLHERDDARRCIEENAQSRPKHDGNREHESLHTQYVSLEREMETEKTDSIRLRQEHVAALVNLKKEIKHAQTSHSQVLANMQYNTDQAAILWKRDKGNLTKTIDELREKAANDFTEIQQLEIATRGEMQRMRDTHTVEIKELMSHIEYWRSLNEDNVFAKEGLEAELMSRDAHLSHSAHSSVDNAIPPEPKGLRRLLSRKRSHRRSRNFSDIDGTDSSHLPSPASMKGLARKRSISNSFGDIFSKKENRAI